MPELKNRSATNIMKYVIVSSCFVAIGQADFYGYF